MVREWDRIGRVSYGERNLVIFSDVLKYSWRAARTDGLWELLHHAHTQRVILGWHLRYFLCCRCEKSNNNISLCDFLSEQVAWSSAVRCHVNEGLFTDGVESQCKVKIDFISFLKFMFLLLLWFIHQWLYYKETLVHPHNNLYVLDTCASCVLHFFSFFLLYYPFSLPLFFYPPLYWITSHDFMHKIKVSQMFLSISLLWSPYWGLHFSVINTFSYS